jgi:hypothetical protein
MPHHSDEHAIAWDFTAALDDLLTLQSSAEGWRRWDDLRQAAESLVATARATDHGQQLRDWLDEQAVLLIGQQLLVRSVHLTVTRARRWNRPCASGTCSRAVTARPPML